MQKVGLGESNNVWPKSDELMVLEKYQAGPTPFDNSILFFLKTEEKNICSKVKNSVLIFVIKFTTNSILLCENQSRSFSEWSMFRWCDVKGTNRGIICPISSFG